MSSFYVQLATLARSATLTGAYLQSLYRDQMANNLMAMAEHAADGTHNALEVPIAVAEIDQAAGAYSVNAGTSSSAVLSVTKNGVGDITVNLDPAKAIGSQLIPMAVAAEQPNNRAVIVCPYTPGMTGSHVRLRIYEVNAGGSGNDWALQDRSIYLVVYSIPRTSGQVISPPALITSGVPLEYSNGVAPDPPGTALNRFITNQGQMFSNLTAGHQPDTGAHSALEPAQDVCYVNVVTNPASPTFYQKTANVSSCARVAVGHYQVTLAAGLFTTPFVVFGQAQTFPGSLPVVMVLPKGTQTATLIDVWLYDGSFGYGQNAGASSAVDCDFSLEIHTVPRGVNSSSYAKQPRYIQDATLGFVRANALAQNEAVFHNAYSAEHADWDSNRGLLALNPGQHNTVKVPRTVDLLGYESVNKSYQVLLGSLARRLSSVLIEPNSAVLVSMISGLSPWLHAQPWTPLAGTPLPVVCNANPLFGPAGSANTGLFLQLMQLTALVGGTWNSVTPATLGVSGFSTS